MDHDSIQKPGPSLSADPLRVTFIGHSTLLIEMDGVRLLTDPLLRDRMAHLRRHAPPPREEWLRDIDAVLISHLHLDHLDVPSLKRLGREVRLIVPSGAGQLLRRRGFRAVDEIRRGGSLSAGSLRMTATPANHSGFRPPVGPAAEAVGFVVSGSLTLYFAGDTDLFPQMSDLAGTLDLALVPIWGWGRALGPGHLDPERAAEALARLQPRLAIPIHWGTFAARSVPRRNPAFLTAPPQRFVEAAARLAPQVTIDVLQPGEGTTIAAPAGA